MEKNLHRIEDHSGDRKYFTQIPNMIVNHSTAYEQSLYLVMKRLAGEDGQCYASLNFLSKKMGVDKKTVTTTIEKLLKRKWIKETNKTKVRGGSVRTFIIVDLWKLNIEEYESGRQVTTKKVSGSLSQESGSIIPESGRQTDTKKIYNKNIKEDNDFLKESFATKKLKEEFSLKSGNREVIKGWAKLNKY